MKGEDYFQIGLRLLKYPDEAKKYFKKGADDCHHSKCMLKYAEITQDESYYGLAAEHGERAAIYWVIRKLLAKKNYETALTKLNDYAVGNEDELRYETTFNMLNDKWKAGTISTDEMLTLADLYRRGKGTEKNPQKARELRDHVKFMDISFKAAAGDVESIFQLGKMYLHGDGAVKDIEEAKAWFEKATKAGHFEAKTELDKITTFECLSRKEEWELTVDELYRLADFYEEGRLCPKDKERAKALKTLADFKETKEKADNDDPAALYKISKKYLEGDVVGKNLFTAAKYVEKYSKLNPEDYSKLRGLYNSLSQGFKEMADEANPPGKSWLINGVFVQI